LETCATLAACVLALLAAPLLTGCGDARAKQEDARILAEFRGPNFIPADQRRPDPLGPPYVPHLVYKENFECLVCHGHTAFVFRGQPVKTCPHPERAACLQCHVPWQNKDAPFKFEMLGTGAEMVAARAGTKSK
jgi:nitrate reductase cytochrome c-type subunit